MMHSKRQLLHRTGWALLGSVLLAGGLAAQEKAPGAGSPAGTVLFICEHGSAKSVVAAVHFNRIAASRGLSFRAISRGTVPDAEMAPAAVKGLLGDGLKPDDPAPTKLGQSDLDAAVRVVSFCELPPGLEVSAPVTQWEVPPVSTEYAASRDAMLVHIEQLLLELKDRGSARAPNL
jgi:protein-tyrosine-phosphatase